MAKDESLQREKNQRKSPLAVAHCLRQLVNGAKNLPEQTPRYSITSKYTILTLTTHYLDRQE